jgi:hypothetical protein
MPLAMLLSPFGRALSVDRRQGVVATGRRPAFGPQVTELRLRARLAAVGGDRHVIVAGGRVSPVTAGRIQVRRVLTVVGIGSEVVSVTGAAVPLRCVTAAQPP